MTDGTNPWAADRQNAVEYLALQIYRREYHAKRGGRTPDEADETVTLPLNIARLVLAAAKAGVHKGEGQGGVPLTHSARNHRDGIIIWAKALKAELMANPNSPSEVAARHARLARFGVSGVSDEGMPAGAAGEKAAEEAQAFASQRHGIALALSTIIHGMRSRT